MLGVGTGVLSKFHAVGIIPKNRGLGASRGYAFASPGGTRTLLTYDPRIRFREADKAEEVLWDAKLAIRYHETGSLNPLLGDYQWGTLDAVKAGVEAALDAGAEFVPVALDLETMGKFPFYPDKHIISSQWTVGSAGHSIVVRHYKDFGGLQGVKLKLDKVKLEWLLTNPRVRIWGAGLKFDLVWMAVKWKIHCTNFTFDTLLGGSIVNENRSNSLDWHGRIYTTIGGYEHEFNSLTPKGKKHHKGHMEEYLDHELFLDYAGGDSDATIQSAFAIRKQLYEQPNLARFYRKILHPACRVFEKVEIRGLEVDEKAFKKLEIKLYIEIEDSTEKAIKTIPLKVRAKYADDLKLTRPCILRDTFFSPDGWNLKPFKENMTTKKQEPQTSLDHFKKFKGHKGVDKFLKEYTKLKAAQKTLSTYVKGFLVHLRPDGLFHPTYALYRGGLYEDDDDDSGTVTGRLAAKNPAIQTLPKHTIWTKELRKCYPAPAGYKFWQMDFSQGELRVIACLANELTMIAAYKAGIDLHAKTAAEVNDIPLEEFLSWKPEDHKFHAKYELLRQGGKAGNFGLLYGMSGGGFVEYAFNSYGVVISPKAAAEFRHKFLHELYPGIGVYHETQIAFAREHEYVESPLGRVRHLPLINGPAKDMCARSERQGLNAPTQTTLNDIALLAAIEVEDEFQYEEDTFSVRGSSHDALYGYVREGCVTDSLQRADARVRAIPGILDKEFDWQPQLEFPVDWELGVNWSSLKKVVVAC
jgi:DNA polymerase I-like protein with 3'-5' exonuclease and polymerase domains